MRARRHPLVPSLGSCTQLVVDVEREPFRLEDDRTGTECRVYQPSSLQGMYGTIPRTTRLIQTEWMTQIGTALELKGHESLTHRCGRHSRDNTWQENPVSTGSSPVPMAVRTDPDVDVDVTVTVTRTRALDCSPTNTRTSVTCDFSFKLRLLVPGFQLRVWRYSDHS